MDGSHLFAAILNLVSCKRRAINLSQIYNCVKLCLSVTKKVLGLMWKIAEELKATGTYGALEMAVPHAEVKAFRDGGTGFSPAFYAITALGARSR